MKKKQKKYICIESDISNDESFAMLDGIDSGGESNVDNILNDSDTEFVIDKAISKTIYDTHDVLAYEANVHVPLELTEPQEKDCEVLRKKGKCRLFYDIKWSSRKTCHPCRDGTLQVHAQHDFGENFTPADVFMKVVNTQELLDIIVSETNIYAAQKASNRFDKP